MPWAWVLVSAYLTALVCAAVSQVIDAESLLALVSEYQTLIAGLGTVAALLIGFQQLKRQRFRDVVDAVRHYEPELDAMAELDTELARVMSANTGLASAFVTTGIPIPMDRSRWERLQRCANESIAPAISELVGAVEGHNQLTEPNLSIPFGRIDRARQNELRVAIHLAGNSLRAAIDRRRRYVQELIEAVS